MGRGRSAGVGYMRREALVIECSNLDLSARIASNRSEGVGFEYVLSLEFLRVEISQMTERHGRGLARGRDDGKNGSSYNTDIVKMMWEHSE